MTTLDSVIALSTAADLGANRIAMPAVLEHVRADRYLLVVPARDVAPMRAALPRAWTIVAEDECHEGWPLARVRDRLAPRFARRAGWYLQQFLKIAAARMRPRDALVAIWDADTVPLKPIRLIDAHGRIQLYAGTSWHQPYFDTIERLLALRPREPRSYIAQCLALDNAWVHELVTTLEARHARHWIDAILATLPGADESEFSEYETLGVFAAARAPERLVWNERPWFRWGAGYCGGIGRVDGRALARLAKLFDFVALEQWDHGAYAWLRSRKHLARAMLAARQAHA